MCPTLPKSSASRPSSAASRCSASMLSVRPLPVHISAHSSHLPTRHLPAKPRPWVDVRRCFLFGIGGNLPFGGGGGGGGGGDDENLPFGGGEGADGNIPFGVGEGGDGNIPFGVGEGGGKGCGDGNGNIPFGGGAGGGGGGDGNIPFGVKVGDGGAGGGGGGGDITSGGDEDDASTEGFRVLDSNKRILYLPQHGTFKAPLLHKVFTAKAKGKMECQSSSSMHAKNLEGAEASSSDGQNDEKHAVTQNVLNNTMNSTGNYTYKNSGPETVRMRAINLVHIVDIGIPDDENVSDENEKKMKGRRGFSFNIAVGSLAYSMALIPYWTFCCSNTPLGIFGTWMDILPTAHAVVTISSLLLVGAASHFKEGELPDNHGFKVLKIVQLWVLLWLWAASFAPLRVCRGISNSVVWPFASAALCMIVLSWIAVFQRTEMVIIRIKTMFEKVTRWLRNLRLPECITAKFKKLREKQSQPLERV